MDTTLWILAGLLAAAFTTGGITILALPKERYRELAESQRWVDDFTPAQVKGIGATKLVGSLGLVLPGLTGIATVLTPLAACGMALFMAGAGTTRLRRGEWGSLVGDVAFLSAFAFVAWGRFDLAPF